MGSSKTSPVSPAQREALQTHADEQGFIGFDAFMEVALYHPTEGYYRRNRDRIGRDPKTDFFTSSSFGPVFGELVAASVEKLLGPNDASMFRFIELGAEGGRSVLDGVTHPFESVETRGPDDDTALSGACIVFSNELFDAQPCRRFRGDGENWQEIGVGLTEEGISETVVTAIDLPPDLPTCGPAGYHVDYPTGARELIKRLAHDPWHGLFLAFDYGKSRQELLSETPQGTVRAYQNHRQSTDVLANMGQQDLTCHICWDHLTEALTNAGFFSQPVVFQEAFLVKNADQTLSKIMTAEAGQMSPRKAGLMQLLHPSSLGQKFQVLSAWRDKS